MMGTPDSWLPHHGPAPRGYLALARRNWICHQQQVAVEGSHRAPRHGSNGLLGRLLSVAFFSSALGACDAGLSAFC
jgi:hypothetical protein